MDTDDPPIPFNPTIAADCLKAALHSGGDYADVYYERRAHIHVGYDDHQIKNASGGAEEGVGVRVQVGEATGYAYSESLAPEDLRHAAQTAAQIARDGRPKAAEKCTPRARPHRYVPIGSFSAEASRGIVERAAHAAERYDPRIARAQASLVQQRRHIAIATSDGVFLADEQPMTRLSVSVVAQSDTGRQGGTGGGGGRLGLDYFLRPGCRPEDHGREAARSATVMLDARPAPAGELPVVLAAGESGVLLHEAVGHGLEADFNRKQTSNYSGRIGEMVASPLVSVMDDPAYAGARGSINFDDEGRSAEGVSLIESGRLVGYLHDRLSAEHFQTQSHHGRREDFRSAPMPRMTNTMLLSGPHDPDEILKATKFGVFARKFSGGQVDISNGDFVFSLTECYLIEDGKLTAPLTGVNLIGNGPDALSKVDMMGQDLTLSEGIWTCGKDGQSVPVGIGCPTFRVSAMTVGGTEVSS